MFKPVTTPEQFAQFDQETIELYRKRDNDPRLTYQLMQLPRRARAHLPFYVDKNNEYVQNAEKIHSQLWWKILLGFGIFSYSLNEWCKIYYPYGIIIRRSIPVSMTTQIKRRAPMAGVFLFVWWAGREYPRKFKADLTSDSE